MGPLQSEILDIIINTESLEVDLHTSTMKMHAPKKEISFTWFQWEASWEPAVGNSSAS